MVVCLLIYCFLMQVWDAKTTDCLHTFKPPPPLRVLTSHAVQVRLLNMHPLVMLIYPYLFVPREEMHLLILSIYFPKIPTTLLSVVRLRQYSSRLYKDRYCEYASYVLFGLCLSACKMEGSMGIQLTSIFFGNIMYYLRTPYFLIVSSSVHLLAHHLPF